MYLWSLQLRVVFCHVWRAVSGLDLLQAAGCFSLSEFLFTFAGVTERDGGMEWEYIIFLLQSSWVFQLCVSVCTNVAALGLLSNPVSAQWSGGGKAEKHQVNRHTQAHKHRCVWLDTTVLLMNDADHYHFTYDLWTKPESSVIQHIVCESHHHFLNFIWTLVLLFYSLSGLKSLKSCDK